jgi:large repetitive protein
LVDETVPPGMLISNTVLIDDGWRTHARNVTSTVLAPSLTASRKQVQPARALAGDVLTYTLHLVNTGPITAAEASLSDVLPPELTFVPGSLTGAGANYDPASRRVVWQGMLSMDPAGVLIAYQARLGEQLSANVWVTNTATLSVRGMTLATLEAGVLVNGVDLSSSNKSAHTAEVGMGDSITYTIELHNTGLTVATHAALTDVLPVGLQLAEGSLVGATYDRALRAILWQGALEPQASHKVRFRTAITPSLGGATITNTALVDDGLGNVFARDAGVRVRPSPLAASDMVLEPSQAFPGDVLTYTLRLRNTSATAIPAALRCSPAPLGVISDTLYASAGEVYAQDASVLWDGTLWPQGMVMVRFRARVPLGMSAQTLVTEARLGDAAGVTVVLQAPVAIKTFTVCLPLIRK